MKHCIVLDLEKASKYLTKKVGEEGYKYNYGKKRLNLSGRWGSIPAGSDNFELKSGNSRIIVRTYQTDGLVVVRGVLRTEDGRSLAEIEKRIYMGDLYSGDGVRSWKVNKERVIRDIVLELENLYIIERRKT